MKKLLIACALIAFAAINAQAAKIKWGVSGVSPYDKDESTSGYKMVCFCAGVNWDETDSANQYTTIADATAWAASNGKTTTGVNQLSSATIDNKGSGTTASAYGAMQNIWKNVGAGTKSGDFYAVIFNAADIADATAYMITSTATLKFSTTATSSQTASLSAGSWVAIGGDPEPTPEPTSGLLLLLGVAGLALKRKNA